RGGRVSPAAGGSRRKTDWSMLTPSIRRPPSLLLGSHDPRQLGDGGGDGSAAGSAGGESSGSSLRGSKRKSFSSSGSLAVAVDEAATAGEADENGGEEGKPPRRIVLGPVERLCQGLPKAIPWADVARQFAPISVSVSTLLP
ncbi:unnamed protein product, partial [Ectocarpus sp. 12 AP-2014]